MKGYLEADRFKGQWTTGKELHGQFDWQTTSVESFYLIHNIPVQENRVSMQLDEDGNPIYAQISSGFHDSMGVSMEDEFDLEDEPMSPAVRMPNGCGGGGGNVQIVEMLNVLDDKSFDIEINESLTISAKFLKENNILEISEKSDLDIGDVHDHLSIATDSVMSYDEENEVCLVPFCGAMAACHELGFCG